MKKKKNAVMSIPALVRISQDANNNLKYIALEEGLPNRAATIKLAINALFKEHAKTLEKYSKLVKKQPQKT